MPTRRVARRAPARRKLIWARQESESAAVPANGFAVDLLSTFRALGGQTQGATVTRVRMDLSLVFPGIINQDQIIFGGLIVDQLNQAEGQVPRPDFAASGEPHADWMWHRGLFPSGSMESILVGANDVLTTYEIDVRSQRKMEELQETLYLSLAPENVVVPSFTCISSVLLRLP